MSGIPPNYKSIGLAYHRPKEDPNFDLVAIFKGLESNQAIFNHKTFNTAGTTTMLNAVKTVLIENNFRVDQCTRLSELFEVLAPQGNQLYSKVRAYQMGFKRTDYPQIDASDDLQTQINRCRFYKDDSTVKLATLTKQGRRFYWVDLTTQERVNLPDHFNPITWRQSAQNAPDHFNPITWRQSA